MQRLYLAYFRPSMLILTMIQYSIHAPADLAAGSATTTGSADREGSPLGLVPHQLRVFLAQFRTMLIEGPAYDRCTGCSATVSPSNLEASRLIFELNIKYTSSFDA